MSNNDYTPLRRESASMHGGRSFSDTVGRAMVNSDIDEFTARQRVSKKNKERVKKFEYVISVLNEKLKELDREKKPFKELRVELSAAIKILQKAGEK